MAKLKVNGSIVPNDYAWYYRWFDEDCTCPNDAENAIAEANGDTLTVEINSPGGEISAGSEIYVLLRDYGNIQIQILGQACSAASIIAMAGPSEMAPTALMMAHCVSTSTYGNHNDMEKTAEMLSTADRALCTAYMEKSGMSQEDALQMMENTTWLTAEDAVNLKLVDKIMFAEESGTMAASLFRLPTQAEMDAVRAEMEAQEKSKQIALARAHNLKLKGEDNYDA